MESWGPYIPPPCIWSKTLRNKHLLVVHPFADLIFKQYEAHRGELFGEYSDLIFPPLKSLQTVKAVQTIAGNNDGWNDWFEALESMKDQIARLDFDIALIACGAYGFPLAAYVKSLGRQAVHVGGPLQLYFGIKGRRWDAMSIYNEHWVRPGKSERPDNLQVVEGGCYW